MSVDDWARREAERQFPLARLNPGETGNIGNRVYMHDGAVWMARHLADVLLSEEAVEAAARALGGLEPGEDWPTNVELGGHALLGTRDDEFKADMHEQARTALQAAVDAVTKEARND